MKRHNIYLLVSDNANEIIDSIESTGTFNTKEDYETLWYAFDSCEERDAWLMGFEVFRERCVGKFVYIDNKEYNFLCSLKSVTK